MGMEMSAVHAEDVHHPTYNYPRALLYSGLIILTTLICFLFSHYHGHPC